MTVADKVIQRIVVVVVANAIQRVVVVVVVVVVFKVIEMVGTEFIRDLMTSS